MKVRLAVLAGLVLLSISLWIYRARTEPILRSDPPPAPPADLSGLALSSLPDTAVLPAFGAAIPPGKNAVWCSTFQMAWDRLKEDVLREPVALSGDPALATLLNRSAFPPRAILPESFYAAAGRGSDGIVSRIRADMSRKFPGTTPDLQGAESAALIAYAYLRVSVPFTVPYFERRKPLSFRDGAGKAHPVHAFGIRIEDDYAYGRLREQIALLHVGAMVRREQGFDEGYGQLIGEFILDPDRNSAPYQVILARIGRKETLAATWAEVEASIERGSSSDPPGIGPNEIFLCPNIRLATQHHFHELEGRVSRNKGADGLTLSTAVQSIRFVLNRSGAELGSEAKMMMMPVPRYFVIDGPFLVILRMRGAREPFFALWVENPDVLECWPKK